MYSYYHEETRQNQLRPQVILLATNRGSQTLGPVLFSGPPSWADLWKRFWDEESSQRIGITGINYSKSVVDNNWSTHGCSGEERLILIGRIVSKEAFHIMCSCEEESSNEINKLSYIKNLRWMDMRYLKLQVRELKCGIKSVRLGGGFIGAAGQWRDENWNHSHISDLESCLVCRASLYKKLH